MKKEVPVKRHGEWATSIYSSSYARKISLFFESYQVKKIVTICPHTYNTFKNEYPEFGLKAEVYHHTELIWKLLEEGRIKPSKEVHESIAYHDSCYLGRYNNIFDIPRKILTSIPGVQVLEMERNRQDSMCCRAGGGMMWMEENTGQACKHRTYGTGIAAESYLNRKQLSILSDHAQRWSEIEGRGRAGQYAGYC